MRYLIVILTLILISCSNKKENTSTVYKINIITDKTIINANGIDFAKLEVQGIQENNEIINLNEGLKFYNENGEISSNFKTLIEDEYLIWAEYNGIKSSSIKISAKHDNDFIFKGADISFLPELEDNNIKFKNFDGNEEDILTILKENGINTIRLRLWVNNEYCNLEKTLYMAKKIKSIGMNFLLDFHYSDTWADPANQIKPSSWEALTFEELEKKVYDYTFEVLEKLEEQKTMPQLIQIGNEINTGIIKPEGSNESDFKNLSELLKSGIKAVKDTNENIKIILHISGYDSANWFFDNIKENNLDFDIIGLSYYPWWHGKDFIELESNLKELVNKYNKDIMIIETAYPWTLSWNDWTNNIVGLDEHLITGYPASVEGQKEFLKNLINIVKNNSRGKGIFYWAPEYVAYKGTESKEGSSWENLTLFDFNNKVLNSIKAFKDGE